MSFYPAKRWLRVPALLCSGVLCNAICLPAVQGAEVGISERLISALLNKHIATTLYEERNIPLQGGSYELSMVRTGPAVVERGSDRLRFKLPVKTRMEGKIKKDLGFALVDLSCLAQFANTGQIEVIPAFSGDRVTFESVINFPIPPVTADCGSIQIPVDAVLRNLVETHKGDWEKQISARLNEEFNTR